jgi:hypothetical protein
MTKEIVCEQVSIIPTGDGFKYQSINADCLSAIAYFRLRQQEFNEPLPKLIYEWNTNESSDGSFPFFKCSCGNYSGSQLILFWKHSFACPASINHLDTWMNQDQRADAIA